MSALNPSSYLSIGDALNLLREEFPDVTISKIRFLESQGLIDPERTASGYRKFYDEDISRLRFILREQRENFLPLKVIRDRLDESIEQPQLDGTIPPEPVARVKRPSAPALAPSTSKANTDVAVSRGSLNRQELAASSGVTIDKIQELEKFGLIAGRQLGRETYYDDAALVVANLAASFGKFGVEARHLRIYKNAAEREAGFFEQIVVPMLAGRSPQARTEALAALSELSQLGSTMRATLIRQALDKIATP